MSEIISVNCNKQESFWRTLLFGKKVKNGGGGCANTSSDICKGGAEPNVEMLKHLETVRKQIPQSEFDSEEGALIAWETDAPVVNCNGSIDHLRSVIYFLSGNKEFKPDPVTHKMTMQDYFHEKPGVITGDLIYYNPNTGEEINTAAGSSKGITANFINLHPSFEVVSAEQKLECWAPEIRGLPQIDPPEPYLDGEVRIYKRKENIVPQCNIDPLTGEENPLEVNFVIMDETYRALANDEYYEYPFSFPRPDYYEVTLVAKQGGLESSKTRGFSILPCKPVIGFQMDQTTLDEKGNAIYGEPVGFKLITDFSGLGCNDNQEYDVTLRAGTSEVPMLLGTHYEGVYSAMLVAQYWAPPITAVIKKPNQESVDLSQLWSFNIVPPGGSSTTPSAAISSNLEYAHHVDDTVNNITCYTDADPLLVTFDWNITRPCPNNLNQTVENYSNIQTIPSYNFDCQGKFVFKCFVNEGVLTGQDTREVGVYSVGVPVPSAVIGNLRTSYTRGDLQTDITASSDDPLASFAWEITRPDTVVNSYIGQIIPYCLFDLEGDYDFNLTVTAGDGVTKNQELRSVGVYPPEIPMPVLIQNHNPASGPGSGYNIDFNASGSYSPIGANINSFMIIYGDGQSGFSTSGIFPTHAYPNPGAGNSAVYDVYLYITDENGMGNSTSIGVSVWGD